MNVVLDNGSVTIEIERSHGRIVRFGHKTLGIELVHEPRLADNFRLLLPLPDWRGHYVLGKDQTLYDVAVPDATTCQLRWRGLRSSRGKFDIEVLQTIQLDGNDVTISMEIDNRSAYEIEEVCSVTVGGLTNPAERDQWRFHYADVAGRGEEWAFYDRFPGSYLGPAEPVWSAMYPGNLAMPWVDLYNSTSRKGVYIGNHDLVARHTLVWAQLTPCATFRNSTAAEQSWPDPALGGGTPIAVALAWISLPFLAPGGHWDGPPIVFHFHTGTWWAAADYFRQWYDAHTTIDKTDSWLAEEDAWQSTIISYPEGTTGYRFADLPQLARAAKECGINVLQIDGWDVGGIDRDYPNYAPDPRLGTVDEFRNALDECRAIGVNVLLFSNLQVVNIETDWFREELHKYVMRDPRQNIRDSLGWEYNTTLGLQNQTIHRMVVVNPTRPEYRRIIVDQLQGIVDLGAHGTQIDKLNLLALIDYAKDNPAPRDESLPRGVLEVLAEFTQSSRRVNPDFRIAAEAHWDRAIPYVDASYSRFFSNDHLPTFAYTFPEFRQSCCITGDWDFGLVNNCLRFGHIINIEARYLHGSAADVPNLARYVAEALRVRRRLRHRLWHSRLVEPMSVEIDVPDGLLYAVHEARSDQLQSVVLNHFELETLTAELKSVVGQREVVLHRPFKTPERHSLPVRIDVPRDEFVVVAPV